MEKYDIQKDRKDKYMIHKDEWLFYDRNNRRSMQGNTFYECINFGDKLLYMSF